MVATRDLAANSREVMKAVKANGYVVVTKDGKPSSIIISTSSESLIADVNSVVNMKAKNIMSEAQARALSLGTNTMSQRRIDAEISASRKSRKNTK